MKLLFGRPNALVDRFKRFNGSDGRFYFVLLGNSDAGWPYYRYMQQDRSHFVPVKFSATYTVSLLRVRTTQQHGVPM
jgi:hypothetical protein